jgi:hypothetical protein
MHRAATGLDWGVLYTYWPLLGCTVQPPCSPQRLISVHQDRGELALSFLVRMLGPVVVAASTLQAAVDTGAACARLYVTVRDCTRLCATVLDWARLCIHWATPGRPLGKLLGTYCTSTGRYCVALASTVRLLCTLWGLLHCDSRGP